MATRRKQQLEPGNCGICGVTLGTPHAGNCPLGAPPVPPGENGARANSPTSSGPLFVIEDLSPTEDDRPAPVIINGIGYQWARWANFSLRQRRQVAALVETMSRIDALEVIDEGDDRDYTAAIDGLLDIAVPGIAPEHRELLTLRQREEIGAAFLVAYGLEASANRERRTEMARSLIGGTSSRSSSGSTATAAGTNG